jgi:hypothetical protein
MKCYVGKFITLFSICQWICMEVIAICIFWVGVWALTCYICTGFYYSTFGQNMKILCILLHLLNLFIHDFAVHPLFCANLKYAHGLQMHLLCGYIGACLPWVYVCHVMETLQWLKVIYPTCIRLGPPSSSSEWWLPIPTHEYRTKERTPSCDSLACFQVSDTARHQSFPWVWWWMFL